VAFTGVETHLWPTVDHLDPPDLPRHRCNSDRGPAASGGPTVLANDRNGGRLRLNASRHDDDLGHTPLGKNYLCTRSAFPTPKTKLCRLSNLRSLAEVVLKVCLMLCQKFKGSCDLGHAPFGKVICAPARLSQDEAMYQI